MDTNRVNRGRDLWHILEAAILCGYTGFITLVAQYEAIHMETERALENLEVAQTNYELGFVTQFEIEQVYLAVYSAQHEKESILNQKWILAFRLEHPSLLQLRS